MGTASLDDGTTFTSGSEASVNIQDNVELDVDEAALVSQLTGMQVNVGELVDVWSGASELGGLEWELTYLSLDESLYNDLSYRPDPPPRSAVDLVIFLVDEEDAGENTIFLALPEPGSVLSAFAVLIALQATRRSRGARSAAVGRAKLRPSKRRGGAAARAASRRRAKLRPSS